MSDPSFILLYVANPTASAEFYTDLLGHPPVEASPSFAMFALKSGVMLGLWGRDGVAPTAGVPGGGELAFVQPDVDAAFADWSARGLTILQTPTEMDFGRTFLAADPDGHRLRVFAPPPG